MNQDNYRLQQVFHGDDLAARLAHYESVIRQNGKLDKDIVLGLESIKPGLVFDSIGYAAINSVTGNDLEIVLEDIGKYKNLLLAGALGAIIGFILKIIFGDKDGDKERSERSKKENVEKTKEEISKKTDELTEACHQAKANTHEGDKTISHERRDWAKSEIMSLCGLDETTVRGIVTTDKALKDYVFSNPSKFIGDLVTHALRDKLPSCITDNTGRTEQVDLSKLILGIHETASERVDYIKTVVNSYETGVAPDGRSKLQGVLKADETKLPAVYDKDTKYLAGYASLPAETAVKDIITKSRERFDTATKFVESDKLPLVDQPDKLADKYTIEMVTAQEYARSYIDDYKSIIDPLISKIQEFEKTTDHHYGPSGVARKMNAEEKAGKHGRVHKHLIDELKLLACLLSIMDGVSKRFDRLNHVLLGVKNSLERAIILVKRLSDDFKKGEK
jgi:gas vesicle protein